MRFHRPIQKKCFIPTCSNTGETKIMVTVPQQNRRKQWFLAAGIHNVVTSSLFCCEDHFDLSEDAENYIRVKLMGGRLMLKPGVVPHRNLGPGRADSADPTLQHFLLGTSVAPERSPERSENFDVEVESGGTSPIPEPFELENDEEEVEDEPGTPDVPPCSVCTSIEPPPADAPKPKVSRKMSRPHKAETRVGYVVNTSDLLKRSRPRILRRNEKHPKKLPESNNFVMSHDVVVCVKEENDVLSIEDDSNGISEPENIVVDVDLLANTCPRSHVGEVAPIDADPLAGDVNPDDPNPADYEFFEGQFLTTETEGNEEVDHSSEEPSVTCSPHLDPKSNKDAVMHTDGSANDGESAPLVVIKTKPPEYDDVNELSEEENLEMPSSSEDEFPADESVEEETEEDDCNGYLVRNVLCDLEDVDEELHECIKNVAENYRRRVADRKRKSNDDTIYGAARVKKGRTELENYEGCNINYGLLVNVDSKTLVGKTRDGADFIWHTLPVGTMTPESDYRSEPVGCAKDAKDPLECFMLFFTERMMESLIPSTNKKIAQYQGSNSRTFAEIESTKEIKALIGLLVYAAAKKDTHLPLSVMFHVGSSGACYRSIMSSQRMQLLLQCLQCGGKPGSRTKSSEIDLWETFLQNCRSNYRPGRNVTVGDHIIRFTRKCPFRLSKTPERYGLRNTLLVDSSTKYVVDAVPNGGTRLMPENLIKLTKYIQFSNRNITFENPVGVEFISELSRRGLTAVGILNQDEPELPREMTMPGFQERGTGSSLFIHREEMTAVSYKTRSTEVVCFVSSVHCDLELNNKKPEVIARYNSNKDAVRTLNLIVDYVSCARKTKRCTLRIFYDMITIACANAYVVYLHNIYRRLADSNGDGGNREKPLTRFDFLVKLGDKLTGKWVQRRLKDYRSLPSDLVEQAWQVLPGFTGSQIDRRLAEVTRDTQKCAHCPDDARVRSKTCVTCGKCKKPVCRDHLSKFCHKCWVK